MSNFFVKQFVEDGKLNYILIYKPETGMDVILKEFGELYPSPEEVQETIFNYKCEAESA